MKCRLFYATPIVNPAHPLHGQTVPAGGIFDGPDCFWLCILHRSFLRPLSTLKGEETFELVTMDGTNGQPPKITAEPADQECLDECIRRGWMKPDTQLALGISDEPVWAPTVVAPDAITNSGSVKDKGLKEQGPNS